MAIVSSGAPFSVGSELRSASRTGNSRRPGRWPPSEAPARATGRSRTARGPAPGPAGEASHAHPSQARAKRVSDVSEQRTTLAEPCQPLPRDGEADIEAPSSPTKTYGFTCPESRAGRDVSPYISGPEAPGQLRSMSRAITSRWTGWWPRRPEQPHVAVQPLDRDAADVPGAAVDLDRVVGDPADRLAGEVLRRREGSRRSVPSSYRSAASSTSALAAGIGLRVREHGLDELVLADRTAALGAFPGVGDALVDQSRRDPTHMAAMTSRRCARLRMAVA